ncbi:unnamed protein product [Caenorhabditis bovis]|uniref:Serpentine receptor class gamma n=1 Tax=Caenorhabditis bovis TaxID=2654633 RepID=A0A8S1F872_9PELO|nr:unnamed protein product [Caenorhabditis bovis]
MVWNEYNDSDILFSCNKSYNSNVELNKYILQAIYLFPMSILNFFIFYTIMIRNRAQYSSNSFFILYGINCFLCGFLQLQDAIITRPFIYVMMLCDIFHQYFYSPRFLSTFNFITVSYGRVAVTITHGITVFNRLSCVYYPITYEKAGVSLFQTILLLISIAIDIVGTIGTIIKLSLMSVRMKKSERALYVTSIVTSIGFCCAAMFQYYFATSHTLDTSSLYALNFICYDYIFASTPLILLYNSRELRSHVFRLRKLSSNGTVFTVRTMSAILQYDRVTYKCNCGIWKPLPSLYFCRNCFKFKCDECGMKEIDLLFCPRCLEVSSVPDSRMKKNRCFNCNDCPLCENVLSARTCDEKFYLICQYCQWSTREAGVEDRENIKKWPIHENPRSDFFHEVVSYMKRLEVIENAPKELKSRKASKTWSALHLKDKFGLQKMVEKRRKMLAPETKPMDPHAPEDPPTLEDEFNPLDFRSLDELISQPLANQSDALLPARVALQARTLVRCDECERTLIKRDFGASSYKFKISTFAREFAPDVRLSRPVELSPGKQSHVLLSITNHSISPLNLTIIPLSEEGLIKCEMKPLELTLPSTKDANTPPKGVPAERSDIIVFRQHNRVGLQFEVVPANESDRFLGFHIKYTQNGAFEQQTLSDADSSQKHADKPLEVFLKIALI